MSNEGQPLRAALEQVVERLEQGLAGSDEQLRLTLIGKPTTTYEDGEEVARMFVLLVRAQEACEQAIQRWQRSEHISVASEVRITPASAEKGASADQS